MSEIFLEVLRCMDLKSAGWFLTNTVMSMATGSYLSMLKKEEKNIQVNLEDIVIPILYLKCDKFIQIHYGKAIFVSKALAVL